MPEYYLANLEDENPEEVNYASTHPEIVSALEQLHKTWPRTYLKVLDIPTLTI